MASEPAVICCGNVVYDTLIRPVKELHWGATTFVDEIACHAGGNGATTARALGVLGVPVRLLGAVGDDEQGRFLLSRIASAGVDVTHVRTAASSTAATVAIVSATGDRKFFHHIGASADAFPNGIEFTPELCAGAAHFHLASLLVLPRLRPLGAQVLGSAKALGMSTSFDTNWDPQGTWMRDIAPCLPHIDYFFMNQPEAEQIGASPDPARAAAAVLERGARMAVVKMGERGCAIHTAGRVYVCPAFRVEALDSTGAGDCFVAGFLSAMLDGASLPEAGKFANAVGALSVQALGAGNGLLSKAETLAWMETQRR